MYVTNPPDVLEQWIWIQEVAGSTQQIMTSNLETILCDSYSICISLFPDTDSLQAGHASSDSSDSSDETPPPARNREQPKRKAEVLSESSGKIGVTITTTSPPAVVSSKVPRLSEPVPVQVIARYLNNGEISHSPYNDNHNEPFCVCVHVLKCKMVLHDFCSRRKSIAGIKFEIWK